MSEEVTLDQLMASIHPEVKALIADLVVVQRAQQQQIARLTRERDAAVEALKQSREGNERN